MRAMFLMSGVSMTLMSGATLAVPSITRIETITSSGHQSPVSTPFLKPAVPKEYWIFGNRVGDVSKVTLGGVEMGVLEKQSSVIRVLLLVSPNTARGIKELKLTFTKLDCPIIYNPFDPPSCPDFVLKRNVMVLRAGTVTGVSPNSGVTPNQSVTLRFSGSNLQNATVLRSKSMFITTALSNRLSGSFDATGTTSVCGKAVVMVGDEAEGGDVYPYGTLLVGTNATCAYQPVPRPASGSTCPPGQYWDVNAKVCKY